MNNEFKKDIVLRQGEYKFLSYLDIEDKYDSYEYNIHLEDNAELKINLSILSSTNKKVKINVYHDGDNSISECNCYGVSKKGTIEFVLNGYIKQYTKSNLCKQSIQGLLLSDEAKISGNPNLIIDSNKIKANHKLSIGCFNKDYLFYIMSKGISEQNAKLLLANQFYQEHLDNITDETKKEKISNMIKEYFNYEF